MCNIIMRPLCGFAKMFSAAILKTYCDQKHIWIAATDSYVYFHLIVLSPLKTILKLDIASRRSVSPDGTWLKRDIQRITLTHTISYKLSSQTKKLRTIISETQATVDIRD